jgi:hypothetical protein
MMMAKKLFFSGHHQLSQPYTAKDDGRIKPRNPGCTATLQLSPQPVEAHKEKPEL